MNCSPLDSTDFLLKFHGQRRWVLSAIHPYKKAIITATFDVTKIYDAQEWITKYNEDHNIYFSVGEVAYNVDKKAAREDISSVAFLHVDIDPRAGEPLEDERKRILAKLRQPTGVVRPTIIVDSGGGFWGFWQLKTSIPTGQTIEGADDIGAYNRQIEILLGGDSCWDISRIARLPGCISWPDEKKKKKGRVPAKACVVEWNDKLIYDISQFIKAPIIQATGNAQLSINTTLNIDGNIARLSSLDELPPGVPEEVKKLIIHGNDVVTGKHASRSEAVFRVACALVKYKCPDETIYSILTDPDFKISESVRQDPRGAHTYAIRQIARAKEKNINPELMRMNDQFAVISNIGGKCRVIEELVDKENGRSLLTKQNFADFVSRHMHIKVPINRGGKEVYTTLGDWWLRHPMRRQYERVVFAPGREVPGAYNQWQGFSCQAIPGDCRLLLDHIFNNVCDRNEKHYEYLMGWFAKAVQEPAQPGHSAVILRGGMGTGKGFLAKAFGSLFGRHFMSVTDPKHLTGSFNLHLKDCVFLFADEAFYAGDKKHESILKMLVTEETFAVEGKGLDVETSPNYTHILMASNANWVVPVAVDDRRFFVLDVNKDRVNDFEYFAAINKQMNSGGREAFHYTLKTRDISKFDVRRIPKTQALHQQKMLSLEGWEAWWYEKIKEGRILGNDDGWKPVVIKEAIAADYVLFCKGYGFYRKLTTHGMQTCLNQVCGEGYPQAVQLSRDCEIIGLDGHMKLVKRPMAFKLPTLKACRAIWEVRMGKRINWDEGLLEDEENVVTEVDPEQGLLAQGGIVLPPATILPQDGT